MNDVPPVAPSEPSEPSAVSWRVLTVPNVLSLIRLACIPLFLWLLFGREHRAAAAVLLGALGATDWVDGYVARHFGQVTELGKILDPTADRLLLLVGIVAITADGSAPLWFALAAITREVLVAAAALVLAALGARRIDVTWWGKAGTFGLMFAFPLFLAGDSTVGWNDTARVLAWVSGIPGLVFGYYALITYVPLGRRALREGRMPPARVQEPLS
jgi:cardiolipin synthase